MQLSLRGPSFSIWEVGRVALFLGPGGMGIPKRGQWLPRGMGLVNEAVCCTEDGFRLGPAERGAFSGDSASLGWPPVLMTGPSDARGGNGVGLCLVELGELGGGGWSRTLAQGWWAWTVTLSLLLSWTRHLALLGPCFL